MSHNPVQEGGCGSVDPAVPSGVFASRDPESVWRLDVENKSSYNNCIYMWELVLWTSPPRCSTVPSNGPS